MTLGTSATAGFASIATGAGRAELSAVLIGIATDETVANLLGGAASGGGGAGCFVARLFDGGSGGGKVALDDGGRRGALAAVAGSDLGELWYDTFDTVVGAAAGLEGGGGQGGGEGTIGR
jgi:hypothetical protein